VNKQRQLIYFRGYFWEFYNKQSEQVKEKIDQVLFLVTIAEKIPKKFFNKIKGYDGLFEIRIEYSGNNYRVFCCFDEGNLVVLFQGFHKKTQKTPKKELDKAARIKEEYFEYKKKRRSK
jgi:phage-related protein